MRAASSKSSKSSSRKYECALSRVGVGGRAGEGLDGRDVDGDDEVRLGVEVAARAEAGGVECGCASARVSICVRAEVRGGAGGGSVPSPPVMEVVATAAEAAERAARAATAKRIFA